MRDARWIRLVLCGYVAGVVWFLLSMVILAFVAPNFVPEVRQGAPHAAWGGALGFGIDIVMGVWAIWLYTAIAPRYGSKPTTAAIVGVAWWTIKSLQSAKWVGLGLVETDGLLIGLGASSLVAAVVASVVGAWLYDKVTQSAAQPLPAT